MSLVIYKYSVAIEDHFCLRLPVGADVLSCQVQNNNPVIWALVDPEETEFEEVDFYLYGTGNPIDENEMDSDVKFIDTFQLHSGSLVFHLFWRLPEWMQEEELSVDPEGDREFYKQIYLKRVELGDDAWHAARFADKAIQELSEFTERLG